MRICITRSERHSYSETFIRDQIAGLSKLADVYPIHSGRLPERSEDGRLLSSGILWLLHKIVKTVTGNRNNYFGNYGIKKFLKQNNIDVVLANYGLSGAHMAPICRALNIPLLVIFHGHDATDKKLLKEYAIKYQELFSYAASIITVSRDMHQRIIALGAPPQKVHVVSCGVDLFKFNLSAKPKEQLFLAVGRFVSKKGPLFTIQAFYQVWKKNPDARLIMVGAHRGLYESCLALVHSLSLQQVVTFPGILAQDEIRELISRAIAFVQHSVVAPNGDMEGTPVSILEAAASGLPVISTLHGGIKDAVIHGTTGYLVPEGDFSAMANYMIALLDNPAQAKAMGNAARAHIAAYYGQQEQIKKLYVLASQAISA